MARYEWDAGRVIEYPARIHNSDDQHDCNESECPPASDPEVVVDFTRAEPSEDPIDGIARGLAQLAAWFMNEQKKY